jgi:hypothetical protein
LPSMTASVAFTALSTLFNLYAMRRGALLVGTGRQSLWEDLRRLPRIVWDFITLVPRILLASRPRAGAVKARDNS